jgi:MFS family permease
VIDLQEHYPKPSVAWFAVAVLMLAYALSFIDRMILSLLVEPIKLDLQISDFKISLLQGFSFALFYAVAGIPIGRLVDVRRRTTIIVVGVAAWSLMTVACGLARQYWQLFLARTGVGVGEAALGPAAYSMLGDLFPPDRRGLALGLFSAGTSIGAGLALIIGGYAIHVIAMAGSVTLPVIGILQPWQLTFIYVGTPGLLVAALVAAIPEPVRRGIASGSAARDLPVPVPEVIAHFRRYASVIGLHHVANSLSAMAAYGIMSWAPAMLMRVHGWAPQEVGLMIGGCILAGGTLGVILGGWFGDHLLRRGQVAGRFNAAAISMMIGAAGAVSYPFQESALAIAMCLVLAMLGGFMVVGNAAAALLDFTPDRLRGQAAAIFFLFTSLLGIGVGPTLVALFTDYVFGYPESVRYSLAIVPTLAFLLAAACFLAVRAPYQRLRPTALPG